jgi:hypothetical protein
MSNERMSAKDKRVGIAMLAGIAAMFAMTAQADVNTTWRGEQAVAVTNLAGEINSECSAEDMRGKFVKRDFEKDGIKPKGYVFEQTNGERSYINAPILDIEKMGLGSYGAVLSALGQLTREGRRAKITVIWCAKALTLQNVRALGR